MSFNDITQKFMLPHDAARHLVCSGEANSSENTDGTEPGFREKSENLIN